MPKFYFTYGTDPDYPFQGGWTEIEAPDPRISEDIFEMFHPSRKIATLNCAFAYTEEKFKETKMYKSKDNFGGRCHERIILTRELLDTDDQAAPPEGGSHANED